MDYGDAWKQIWIDVTYENSVDKWCVADFESWFIRHWIFPIETENFDPSANFIIKK